MHNHIIKIFDSIKQQLNTILVLRDQFTEKSDGSFVSKGDLLVQDIVLNYLHDYLPSFRLISEEQAPFDVSTIDIHAPYIVLDPIDGTENFVSGLREWGVGISIFDSGQHLASGILLPELYDQLVTGDTLRTFNARIIGLSSSLSKDDLAKQPSGYEYRVIGCSMYNMLSAIRGSFQRFENVRGVHAWDILPGLNLALEHGCSAYVDDMPYEGQLLLPVKKYRIKIFRGN